jgi:hypothetical protein
VLPRTSGLSTVMVDVAIERREVEPKQFATKDLEEPLTLVRRRFGTLFVEVDRSGGGRPQASEGPGSLEPSGPSSEEMTAAGASPLLGLTFPVLELIYSWAALMVG